MTRYLEGTIFAVLWTAAMWWWSAPLDTVPLIMLMVTGLAAGALFHWLMGLFAAWWWRPTP